MTLRVITSLMGSAKAVLLKALADEVFKLAFREEAGIYVSHLLRKLFFSGQIWAEKVSFTSKFRKQTSNKLRKL